MERFFDTHAHYTDEKLAGNFALTDELFASDICGIICVATDNDDAKKCIATAARYPHMYASAGIHPSECMRFPSLGDEIERLRLLCREKKVVAIGEIGLDYHYDFSEKDVQKRFFEAQMQLAEELDMPVIIHDREAHSDVFETVKAHPRVRGVMHSYSGSAEMAREYIRLGWYLSFSGVVTFTNAAKTHEAAKATPLDRLLIETDAPYLAPVPMRGKTNHSGYIHYTAEKIAELHGVDVDTVARKTAENARKLFRISE